MLWRRYEIKLSSVTIVLSVWFRSITRCGQTHHSRALQHEFLNYAHHSLCLEEHLGFRNMLVKMLEMKSVGFRIFRCQPASIGSQVSICASLYFDT